MRGSKASSVLYCATRRLCAGMPTIPYVPAHRDRNKDSLLPSSALAVRPAIKAETAKTTASQTALLKKWARLRVASCGMSLLCMSGAMLPTLLDFMSPRLTSATSTRCALKAVSKLPLAPPRNLRDEWRSTLQHLLRPCCAPQTRFLLGPPRHGGGGCWERH